MIVSAPIHSQQHFRVAMSYYVGENGIELTSGSSSCGLLAILSFLLFWKGESAYPASLDGPLTVS